MDLTLNKIVGAGRNLNDFRDGTNKTRNFQKKRQASDMPRKQILKVAIATQERLNLHVQRPKLFLSTWLNKHFKFYV